MRIVRITATEVVVGARPGALGSPGFERPLHKIPSAGSRAWSIQFDQLPKLLLQLELVNGVIGLGELYRDHDWGVVGNMADTLLGQDIRAVCRADLPFARVREYDGFELAVWDAFAKAHDLPLVDLLGGPVRDKVRISAWSGPRRTDDVAEFVQALAQQGHTTIKFKCDLRDDVVGWCAAIAGATPDLMVILDPNERFERPHEARHIASRLGEVGNVFCLEDPIPHWMHHEYADLRRQSPVPIARHIALGYPMLGNRIEDVVTAVQHRGVDAFNFSAGLIDFQRLEHVADLAGLPCFHGSEIDLGILEAAYVHSACAARSCTWPSDIFGRSIRTHDLLAKPLEIEPPWISLPHGPGLGVHLDVDAVRAHCRDERVYTA